MKRFAVLLVLLLAVCHPAFGALKVSLVTDPEVGRASKHGLEEFRRALEVKGIQIEDAKEPSAATGDMVVVAGLSQGPGPAASLVLKFAWGVYTVPESLVIHKLNDGKKPLLLVGGSDDRGLMYALLDVADRVGWSKNSADPFSEVHDTMEKPDAPER